MPALTKKPVAEQVALDAETRVEVRDDNDLVTARQSGRALAKLLGFDASESTLIATAISELSRNIVRYAERGSITLRVVRNGSRHGLRVEALDSGPGIPDIEVALQPGYSSSGGLGLGLPGVRRIVDEFEIDSAPGRGTRVTVVVWR